LGALAANLEVKPTIPLFTIARVLESKHIKFSSGYKLASFIDLFYLGMSNNVKLDSFFFFNTLVLQVNCKCHFRFSCPVTSEVLKLLRVRGSRTDLGHSGKTSLIFCILTNPKLRSDQSPHVVSSESHIKLSIHNVHTDFSSLHRLFISSCHNCVTSGADRRLEIDFWGVGTDWLCWSDIAIARTVDFEIEPTQEFVTVPN